MSAGAPTWKSGTVYKTRFWVFNSSSAGVTGLVAGNFTLQLTANGANSAQAVTITEVDAVNEAGAYDASYTPNATGPWSLRVSHSTYAPKGYQDDLQVVSWDITSATNLGLSALPTASPGANGGLPTADASNQVKANLTQCNGNAVAAGAIPNAAAAAAGGLPTVGAGAGQINVDGAGRVPSNVQQVAGQTASAAGAVTFPGSIGTSTYAGGAVASVTGNVSGDVAGKVLGGGASALIGVGVQADVEQVGAATTLGGQTLLEVAKALAVMIAGTSSGMSGGTGTATWTLGALTMTLTIDANGNRTAAVLP